MEVETAPCTGQNHFEETKEDELFRTIAAYPLGALVVNGPDGLDANHMPFLIDDAVRRKKLLAHVARANPLWKQAKDDLNDRVKVSRRDILSRHCGHISSANRVPMPLTSPVRLLPNPRLQRDEMIPAMKIDCPSRRDALRVLAALTVAGCATQSVSPAEPESLVADAQTTFSNFMRDPSQTWIHDNLGRARAVLISPQVVRAGYIFGGSGGRGVLVARDGSAWVGPAFYNLATASVGFQAGIDLSEVIIVVMTDKGFDSLLSTSFKIGGDASIAAGPVGAGAKSTVTADLISFTRSKGLYGGLSLDGTVVSTNIPWNDAFFGGSNLFPADILIRKSVTSPKATPLLADIARATK